MVAYDFSSPVTYKNMILALPVTYKNKQKQKNGLLQSAPDESLS